MPAGAINNRKSRGHWNGPVSTTGRNNTYINPNYKPPTVEPLSSGASQRSSYASGHAQQSKNLGPREVVIDGVAFQSSNRSLVRKDRTSTVPWMIG